MRHREEGGGRTVLSVGAGHPPIAPVFPIFQALKLAGGQVLEPVMSLEVTLNEEHLSFVLGDLAQRRGSVTDIQSRHDNKVLLATVPLAEMMGYSTALRTVTSGCATFSLELDAYEAMNPQDQNMLLKKMGGLL
ncbi:mitochondrial-like [Nothobranchius furzeri]|uniref:Mitochondrial-like n=1 Tax=Nothobranchius furzeri TaxID=105023 RepID=A0A9D2YCD4_NOTFU|nr:mitochondrial-like [Nothobranchius furzeri]